MAHVLGIPSTREDIDGSMVRDVYSEENGPGAHRSVLRKGCSYRPPGLSQAAG
jgi:hypothetical protein